MNDLCDLVVFRQVGGNRRGVFAMGTHAQRQGLKPLDKLERVERAHRSPHVAQQRDPRLDNIGDRAHWFDGFGPDRAVIARVGLVQHWEAFLM